MKGVYLIVIMLEISIPAIDKEYDFKIDEDASVKLIIEEIAEMVCRREQNNLIGDESEFLLCNINTNTIFDKNKSLRDYGIGNGEKLIMV